MSFWYGLTFEDVSHMPMAAIEAYMQRLPARIAEYKLAMADATSIPHMEKGARSSTLRQWTNAAYAYTPAKIASPARLKMMGIAVKHV